MIHGHSHDVAGAEVAHLHTDAGLRVAVIATGGLLVTGAVELIIFVLFARSAGLLADAFHNLGDVSTTVAIGVAFALSRRAASERHPYGLHRAEDLAGLFVLLAMAGSAVAAGWESVRALMSGNTPDHLAAGMGAALVGALGNEAVAQYKIMRGRQLGSVSLVADGQHSRQDGLVSIAAFVGLLGVALGFDRADGIAGLLITGVLVVVIVTTARGVIGRALDEVDPALVGRIGAVAAGTPTVVGVHDVRARWAGRTLWASLNLELPEDMTLAEAHAVAQEVHHALLHEIVGLTGVDIHMDPSPDRDAHHEPTAHHLAPTVAGRVPAHHHDDDHDHDHDHDDEHAHAH